MTRSIWAVVALISLAGCAENRTLTEVRPSRTPAEQAEVNKAIQRFSPVVIAMRAANEPWCPSAESRCVLAVSVGIGNGFGAWSGETVVIPIGTLNWFRSDAEYAVMLGHEWGHRVLGHTTAGGFSAEHELEADCFGAVVSQWAGYDASAGAEVMSRMRQAEVAEGLALMLVGVYGGNAKLPWNQRYQMIVSSAAAAKGQAPTRENVQRICGVKL